MAGAVAREPPGRARETKNAYVVGMDFEPRGVPEPINWNAWRGCGLALAVLTLLALVACDDEQTSGDVVGPLAGPGVAESVLALEVVDGAPVGITDVFLQDEEVNLWVRWRRLEPPHDVEAVWLDPDGGERATVLEITDAASEQVTVFTLELTPVSVTGRWVVELFLDGEFVRSHAFMVLELLPAAGLAAD